AAAFIVKGLRENGHAVDLAEDGRQGLFLATSERFDAIILDRMLPGLDGLTILSALRASENTTPVLILSALDGVDDRVRGLKAGGDDYLTKPFAFSELLARIEAMTRRGASRTGETHLRVGDLEIDLLARTVTRAGRPIELLPREFRLLEVLARHSG
ncbi:response regulator transcription factor, partial [Leclercia adecarboxylata]|uniref:response regulator transcription factor n=1 Tax=Leclercia adecarboxylata TaxID=83655 RepID=UPI00234D94EE